MTSTSLIIPTQIQTHLKDGSLLAVNHSGGKDSQVMLIKIMEAGVPKDQLILVHAHLGKVEWPGTIRHIRQNSFGIPLVIAHPGKTFFEMVTRRGMFPSPKYRQCTSDLKRGPIERELRRYLRAHPRFGGQIISAMGMRAAESPARARRSTFQTSKRNSKAGRNWIDWLPIHNLSTPEVFETIASANQRPHWAYSAGMTRLSCSFCIMSSRADLRCAAKLRPALFEDYCRLEREINHTLSPSGRPLSELVA